MSRRSARPASTNFVNFDMSVVHSVGSLLWRHWCTPLRCLKSTTATSFSLELQRLPLTSCSECWTRQLVWLLVPGSSTAVWSRRYTLSSTGLMHLSASSISSVCLCVAVWMELLHGISRHTATASRHHLRSAASHQFVVPSYRLSSYGRRAFSVAGPMTWNRSLPRHLPDPIHTISVFGRLLKTFFCFRALTHAAH